MIKEAYFSFAPHPDGAGKFVLPPFKSAVESFLTANPDGNALVVIERPDWPLTFSENVHKLVNAGVKPSKAYINAVDYQKTGKFLTDAWSSLNFGLRKFNRRLSIFAIPALAFEELDMLDNLTLKYPHRISVLPENIPDDELPELEKEFKRRWDSEQKRKKSTREGKFDQGVIYFKTYINSMAEQSRTREDRIAERISHEDVQNVFVRFGIAHTRISHILRRQGYTVKRDFINTPAYTTFIAKSFQIYYAYGVPFEPSEILIRRRIFFPKKEISDVEWYQGLIAQSMYEWIEGVGEVKDKDSIKNALHRIYKIIRDNNFITVENIKSFGEAIKKNGYERSMKKLMKSGEPI